jgi:hypothetical protein
MSESCWIRCYSTTALDLVIVAMKDVCLSTMMAEYYALPLYARSPPCAELIKTVVPQCGFDKPLWHSELPYMKILQAASLAALEPGQHTPRSKFYKGALVPLFLLHEDDDGTDGPIVIRKIDTKVQLADIFLKSTESGLRTYSKLLMGW